MVRDLKQHVITVVQVCSDEGLHQGSDYETGGKPYTRDSLKMETDWIWGMSLSGELRMKL